MLEVYVDVHGSAVQPRQFVVVDFDLLVTIFVKGRIHSDVHHVFDVEQKLLHLLLFFRGKEASLILTLSAIARIACYIHWCDLFRFLNRLEPVFWVQDLDLWQNYWLVEEDSQVASWTKLVDFGLQRILD